ncbi:MAG TPA: hypothetical protein VJB35_02090 [Candidatus Nanoarchaeia archaeon]|nr:hypothetical protein [uncultured archaeon]AQS29578.1 hypothetical protein [uncultured archaeon]HLD55029.1 hypothetical protein [Candidatus Nanoarchaeia archaeon]
MNRKLLVLFFAMFLLEGVFGLVGAINYTASSSSEVYTGFSWDNYKNYSISWNEYLGNLFYTSGYVGIGTTTPQQKLDVVGNINSTGFINATTDVCIQGGACLSTVSASAGGWTKTGTQVALTTATDNVSIGSTDFFVDNSKGYVGIGTTGPNATLEVYAGADTTQILWGEVIRNAGNNAVTGYGSGLKLKISGDSVDEIHKWAGVVAVAGTVYANRVDMAFYSSNNAVAPTELMRIRGDGNVGIGTTAPTKKFEVNGTAGAFNVNPDNAGGPLLNTTSGNVTITSAGGSVIIRLG